MHKLIQTKCPDCPEGLLQANWEKGFHWHIECGTCKARTAFGYPTAQAAWAAWASLDEAQRGSQAFKLTIPEDGTYIVNGETKQLRRGDVVTVKKR